MALRGRLQVDGCYGHCVRSSAWRDGARNPEAERR